MKYCNKYLICEAIVALSFMIITVSACYTWESYTVECWEIVKVKSGNIYVAVTYCWGGTEGATYLTVPDEYDGSAITQIGAEKILYPFSITYPETYKECNYYHSYSGEDIAESCTITFTIYIGKNISTLDSFSSLNYNAYYQAKDRKIIELEATFCYECSAENAIFYSDSGVLYNNDGSIAQWQKIC